MNKRPTSVTVISWILIVMGGISLITTTAMLNNPMVRSMMRHSIVPLNIQYVMCYLGLLITIVCGAVMLKGGNWARFLYVAWSLIGFVFALITSPVKIAMIPGFVIFLIISFFLFRPKANEFFTPSERANGQTV